jgi:hypothetical protein
MTAPNLVALLSMRIAGGSLSLGLVLFLISLVLPICIETFALGKSAFRTACVGGDGGMLAVCPADWRSTRSGCLRAPSLKREVYPK